ncbi:hypothetical protein GCM10008090_21490 [Arenicella chitinivorans]|uniref:Peptidase A2 domain-containing protein n=1 Tax=Arenicella chitinivorans TaxID=1329800 RepID=A0A918RT97_9GAMM|nr:retropepsin-like aspartic protease [Arenicella chitinivorans]GHA11429.1 hypothetical protein GCM10008090_21490 [Arenicella chitinivorans]
MKRTLPTIYLLTCLSMLGACDRPTLDSKTKSQTHNKELLTPNGQVPMPHRATPVVTLPETDDNHDPLPIQHSNIRTWLSDGNLAQIKNYVLSHYSALSSSELNAIKQQLLAIDVTQPNALDRLALTAELFDDNLSWQAYARHAERDRHWHEAHKAYLRLSQLEVEPDAQEAAFSALVRTSAYLRNELERNGDLSGIQLLYQQLVDLHPGVTRFRLELAHANLHLGDLNRARLLYEELRYDPDFGAIAEHALDTIERKSSDQARNDEVEVPLEIQGSSMLVRVSLNQQPTTLLLDTGASITALSKATIRALNLPPTGQKIWLATANGQRQASVYSLNQITLGQFTLNRVLVAEIDLEHYDGLLGTDVLSALAQEYDYRLENNPGRLVFTPKR